MIPELASNVLLCGGAARLPGLAERLEQELKRHGFGTAKVTVAPNHSAWLGAKQFASQPLEAFKRHCITPAQADVTWFRYCFTM